MFQRFAGEQSKLAELLPLGVESRFMTYRYSTETSLVDWSALKVALMAGDFCNGRTPDEYRRSAEASHLNVYVYADDEIVGNGRILSDGVSNAYIIDVWTAPAHRRKGIATEILRLLAESVPGQHIYLQTDSAQALYEKSGFQPQPTGMGRIVGTWLNRVP